MTALHFDRSASGRVSGVGGARRRRHAFVFMSKADWPPPEKIPAIRGAVAVGLGQSLGYDLRYAKSRTERALECRQAGGAEKEALRRRGAGDRVSSGAAGEGAGPGAVPAEERGRGAWGEGGRSIDGAAKEDRSGRPGVANQMPVPFGCGANRSCNSTCSSIARCTFACG